MMWFEIVMIAVVGAIGIYVIISAIASTKLVNALVRPVGRTYEVSRNIQLTEEKLNLDDYDSQWDKHPLDIVTDDGLQLHALYIVNSNATTINSRAKVAIIVHGHICNHIHSIKYARAFYNKGYNLVLFDHRYFGQSAGQYCTLGLRETSDLSIVIDKTLATFGDDAYIALHGESMGATTVLNVLQYRQDKIAYAVADCGYSKATSQYAECTWNEGHFPTYPAIWFCRMVLRTQYDIDLRDIAPIKSLPDVDTPICFIHGKRDKLVLPHHSKDMFNKCGNKRYSQLHLVDNAVHARTHLLDNVAYNKIVGDYIQLIENKDTLEG